MELLFQAWKDNSHLLVMMQSFFRELTIVGIWSSILWMIEATIDVDENLEHVFHLAHLSLFTLSLFYIMMVVIVATLSEMIIHRWTIMEYSESERTNKKCPCTLNLYRLLKHKVASDTRDYHSVRKLFVQVNELPIKFRFDIYLKRCVRSIFGELSDLHWSTLFLVLGTNFGIWVPLSLYYNKILPLILLSGIGFVSGLVVYLKSYFIHSSLLKKRGSLMRKSQKQDIRMTDRQINDLQGTVERKVKDIRTLEKNIEKKTLNKLIKRRLKNLSSSFRSKEEHHTSEHNNDDYESFLYSEEDALSSDPDSEYQSAIEDSEYIAPEIIDEVEEFSENPYTESMYTTSGSSYSIYTGGSSGSERQGHHHHHHHHHHQHGAMYHFKPQSDLRWITGCCWPMISCRKSPKQIYEKIHTNSVHEKLFWMNSVFFYQYVVQTLLFYQTTQMAIWIMIFTDQLDIHVLYGLISFLPFMTCVLYFIPATMYNLAISTSIGTFTDDHIMHSVAHKHRIIEDDESNENSTSGGRYHHHHHH
eukprot:TRINITY_DN4745_c1_g1_i4.p1 TRINITY_DN4745_c1_g1~~TRINITY_DN4745_c1_g1_i4.p1  ORF type:complete len:530 (+),score=57.23 TRINITY_DN4745_c1_g1_i4:884-2473(+)